MDTTFTLDELASFSRDEHKLLEGLGLREKKHKPSKKSIQHILNFSKSFSSRPSKLLGRIEQIIN